MEPFVTLTSRTVVLPATDIDTDQIIPARFLTTTTRSGLGERLFADWRYDEHGAPRAGFVLNQSAAAGCRILVAGRNFGCGSSREHAPWALVGWGIRAVIALSFADIFKSNALKNGLLPVVPEPAVYTRLVDISKDQPDALITIDLEKQLITLSDGTSSSFPVDSFSKTCLLNDLDELGYLLRFQPQIEAYEKQRQAG